MHRARAVLAMSALAGALLAGTAAPVPIATAASGHDHDHGHGQDHGHARSGPGSVLGTYRSGLFGEGGAEILAHDPARQRVFAVNSGADTVDVLSIADPTSPVKVGELATPGANSVAVHGRVVAVAEQAEDKTDPGTLSLFDARTLRRTGSVGVGALPDMVTITSDGSQAVVANEGEPEGYCEGQVDPRGSVSIVDLSHGPRRATVRTVGFEAYDGQEEALRARGIRVFGPGATASQDLEPEYVATSGRWAWVTLQENNALARVDLARATLVDLVPLGLKDHSVAGAGLDVNDRDDSAEIVNRQVKGMYQPDAVATWRFRGRPYLLTGNEGDAREYDCFPGLDGEASEEARVKDLDLDPAVFAPGTDDDDQLGRLTVTTTSPRNARGEYTELWAFGARSASILDASGRLVSDTGDLFERATAALPFYNADNDESDSRDTRSDNKGPEPEGVTVGRIGRHTYAFVGLERTSAVVVLDVTRPWAPRYRGLLANRDDTVAADSDAAGDLGPEGVTFVAAAKSPDRRPLLLVGNEVSGTTTIWRLHLR